MNGNTTVRLSPQPDVVAMKRFGLWWQKYQEVHAKTTIESKSPPKVA